MLELSYYVGCANLWENFPGGFGFQIVARTGRLVFAQLIEDALLLGGKLGLRQRLALRVLLDLDAERTRQLAKNVAVNESRKQVEKRAAVVEAAHNEPKRFGGLVEMMDENGRVDRAFKQLQILRHRQEHADRAQDGCTVDDLVALAASGKRFSVIYADPAWSFDTWSAKGKILSSPDKHYGTCTTEEIKALPVAPLAADDCSLLLWGIWPLLPQVIEVISAWGFAYKSCGFLWAKTKKAAEAVTLDGDGLHWGLGYATRSNSEYCLLATKGSPKRIAEDVHQVIVAPVGEHSAKPEEAARRIEQLFGGPYLELYARRPRDGWTVWGNELPSMEMK